MNFAAEAGPKALNMNEPTFRKRQLDEKPLILIDGLFDLDFIDLFDRFLQALPYSLSDYRRRVPNTCSTGNTSSLWNTPQRTRFWKITYSRVRSVTEKACPEPQIELNRVHCNVSLYGDMQLPHRDLTPGMTWLYYSNAVWEPKWMGETIFYDSNEEPIYAVLPRNTQDQVVFAADICIEVVSLQPECIAARRSVAFKFLNQNK